MELRQTILALPVDSLADLSSEISSSDAANLLACWTSLWNPSLLAKTREIPRIQAMEALGDDSGEPAQHPAETLFLVPNIARSYFASQREIDAWQQQETRAPAVHKFARRGEIIALLQQIMGDDWQDVGPLAGDFYALGYAYLLIERLTRAMDYDPIVSQDDLSKAVISAADAALASDSEALATHLADAYDLLTQARTHYYPIDLFLLDLSLIAPSTCGGPLLSECRDRKAGSYLLSGELLEHLAEKEPETLESLRQAVASGRASVCGGCQSSAPLASLSPEALLADMKQGIASFETHLGQRPTLFAHPSGPFAPLLPGLLQRSGYIGVLLANFSGEPIPETSSARTTWAGLDATQLEALNTAPLDMGDAATLLHLSTRMSHAMDYDLAATLLLVGWPGHRSEFYDDLVRVTQRSTVLGRFATLDEYFDVTCNADYEGGLFADAYPSPPPGVAIGLSANESPLVGLAQFAGVTLAQDEATIAQLAQLLSASPVLGASPATFPAISSDGIEDDLPGTLWINTASFEQRPTGEQGQLKEGVPGWGWRWEPCPTSPTAEAKSPDRAEPGMLRNEQMEVWLDPQTGGISAVRLHNRRGNQLSQQLILQGETSPYQLAFDTMEVVKNDSFSGSIASRSRLVDSQGNSLAHVVQTTHLSRDAMQIDVDVEVTPIEVTSIDGASVESLPALATLPALVSRLAFRDSSAVIRRGLQGVQLPTIEPQVVTDKLQLVGEPVSITLLSDLPRTHRRSQPQWLETRMLESIQLQPQRSCVSYLLDSPPVVLASAEQQAEGIDRSSLISLTTRRPTQPAGWWLHLAACNVQATFLAVEEEKGENGAGHDALRPRLRLRLLETEGEDTLTNLAAWRPFTEAQIVDVDGKPNQQLVVSDGEIQIHFAPYEWIDLIATW